MSRRAAVPEPRDQALLLTGGCKLAAANALAVASDRLRQAEGPHFLRALAVFRQDTSNKGLDLAAALDGVRDMTSDGKSPR